VKVPLPNVAGLVSLRASPTPTRCSGLGRQLTFRISNWIDTGSLLPPHVNAIASPIWKLGQHVRTRGQKCSLLQWEAEHLTVLTCYGFILKLGVWSI